MTKPPNPSKRSTMNRRDSSRSTQCSSTVSVGVNSRGSESSFTRSNIAVWSGRIAFIFTLASVAATFGCLSYFLLTESENELTETQFASIADRAVCSSLENTERKRLGVASMAQVLGGANPDASQWPFVTLNNFENTAMSLIYTSKGCRMAFAPLVQPVELEAFEEHAYGYYETSRTPQPFPNGTAVSSFGKGVWGMDPSLDTPDKRYHEIDGSTGWGSPNNIMAPILHHSTGANGKLLMNLHFSGMLGPMIDDLILCATDRAMNGKPMDGCTALSGVTNPNATSWVQGIESGPGSMMMQPVYPSNDPTTLTGIILTSVLWGEIMVGNYADEISGIDIVLETGDQVYTYSVDGGEATFVGEGDLHERKFDSFAVQVDVTPAELFGPTSSNYTLTLYPTQEFYHVYCTRNPRLATIGAVCIIVFTSILFLLYDLFVRREFHAKQELLDAKRKFVRFVSHEVRTPLNSVCMGLTLMKEEIAANTAPGNKNVKYTKAMDWLTLTEEVTANAHSAVDVLNDFLNYDKVQSGKLSLECTIVPIFSLIERTVTEFKLPALKNNLHVSINTPLPPSDQGKDRDLSNERFVVGDAIRLTQVLRNLISNAIKFTPDDGKVSVKASWMSPPQESKNPDSKKSFVLQKGDSIDVEPMGHLLLTVTDTGVGMTQDEIKNVFRQGTQFNVNTLQAGNGSGLGTYIAKGIVKQHDGLLTASSEGLNCGSTFSVTLPVYDILEEQLPSALKKRVDTEDDRESGPLKILVVDDAKMNLKLLMRLLERHGHIVDGAEDGHIAVDKVKAAMEVNTEYDVILMDYQMPGMDGPTASRKIREMGCDAFLVGVTGNVMPEDVNFFKAAGANSVLAKPVKLPDLEALWVEYGVHGNVNVGEDWARAGAHGRNGEDQRPRVSKIELI